MLNGQIRDAGGPEYEFEADDYNNHTKAESNNCFIILIQNTPVTYSI